MKYRFVRYVSR
ncbi:hypothetical protein EC60172_3656A, partial [Escherichia coli 6.0172]